MSWRDVKLKDMGQIVTGGTPSSKKPEQFGKKYPFLTPSDMNEERYVKTERYISEKGYKQFENKILSAGSTCFVCIGATIGKSCQVKQPTLTNQQINSIVPSDDFDNDFVYYLLRANAKKVITRASGAATPIVNKSSFSEVNLKTPKLNTQKKIASVLNTYDHLIQNNQRRIKILEEMAQEIYREWFVRFRFPGYKDVKFVDSELGKIPEEWNTKQLSEFTNTQYGYTESSQEEKVGPKYLRGTDINKASYVKWHEVPYCEIDANDYEKYKLNKGDILIIRMADPGKIGIVEQDVDAVFASYLVRIKQKKKLLPIYYFYYFLNSNYYQHFIIGANTGTTRKSISAEIMKNATALIPPKELMVYFDEIVSVYRNQINNLLKQNYKLKKSRDLLLPKLINGEIEV